MNTSCITIAIISEEQSRAINTYHQTIRNAPSGCVKASETEIRHIWENTSRRIQIEKLGFTSAEDFLYSAGQTFTNIYDTGKGSIGLVSYSPNHTVIWVNLTIDYETPTWLIGSAAPCKKEKFKNKKLLWPATQSDGPGTGHPGNFSPTHVDKCQTVEGAGFTAVPQQLS